MATFTKADLYKFEKTSTDAQLQEFFGELCGFFESNGFVRTGDSGQFDPSTVTNAQWISSTGIYEIRTLSGALSSSAPIYVKFQWYGASARYVRPKVTVGTGSDGAGNITGQWATDDIIGAEWVGPTYSGVIRACVVANEYVGLSVTSSYPSYSNIVFVVGRGVNSSGTVTGDHAMAITNGSGTGGYDTTGGTLFTYDFNTAKTSTLSESTFSYPARPSYVSPKSLEAVLLYRIWANWNEPVAFQHAVCGQRAEWTTGTTVSIANVGGTSHTYIAACNSRLGGSGPGKYHQLLMRWE